MRIAFSQPMPARMDQYMALHPGSVNGPQVPGTVTWSADHMQMTFVPEMPLAAHTAFTLHVGGGMMDNEDHPDDSSRCPRFGGQSVTTAMMGNVMSGMMGAGWQGAGGSYGRSFTFTTS